VILGIDPGSITMGYAVLSYHQERETSGTLKLARKASLAEKTAAIFSLVQELIQNHRVQEMAMEEFFYHKDPRALARISHCRGAAMAAAALAGVPVFEYSPMAVKKAVVGYGHATKEQVAWMLRQTFSLPEKLSPDETDALAVALCHLTQQRRLALTQKGL
jgi:crossover junction endodeoxyribonuclease RuvC